MGNALSEESWDSDQFYSLLPSGEYASTRQSDNFFTGYDTTNSWSETAREVERLVRVGNDYCRHGHYANALKMYEEALDMELIDLKLDENHMSVAITRNNMGIVLNKLGRYEDSMECYWESLRIKKYKLPKDHVNISGTLHNMGVVHKNKNEYEMALACYEDALRIRKVRTGLRSAHCAATIQNMGIVYRDRKDGERNMTKALELLQEALEINEVALGERSIEVANVMNDIGQAYFLLEKFDIASRHYQEAAKLLKRHDLKDDHIYWRENKKYTEELEAKQHNGNDKANALKKEDCVAKKEEGRIVKDSVDLVITFNESENKSIADDDLFDFLSGTTTSETSKENDAAQKQTTSAETNDLLMLSTESDIDLTSLNKKEEKSNEKSNDDFFALLSSEPSSKEHKDGQSTEEDEFSDFVSARVSEEHAAAVKQGCDDSNSFINPHGPPNVQVSDEKKQDDLLAVFSDKYSNEDKLNGASTDDKDRRKSVKIDHKDQHHQLLSSTPSDISANAELPKEKKGNPFDEVTSNETLSTEKRIPEAPRDGSMPNEAPPLPPTLPPPPAPPVEG